MKGFQWKCPSACLPFTGHFWTAGSCINAAIIRPGFRNTRLLNALEKWE
jgi:hypothetical protein